MISNWTCECGGARAISNRSPGLLVCRTCKVEVRIKIEAPVTSESGELSVWILPSRGMAYTKTMPVNDLMPDGTVRGMDARWERWA